MALTLNRPSAPLGVRNAVLWARGRRHVVENFPGPLSIKSVTAGTVAWKTGGREMLVDRDSFLVLNHGEPYSMHIDSRQPVTTLCVFFEPGFVESICGSLSQPDLEPVSVPAGFLPRLRMADAHTLPPAAAPPRLEPPRLTVTEVSGAVGFKSPASFSSLFRRTVGIPPSALRRS